MRVAGMSTEGLNHQGTAFSWPIHTASDERNTTSTRVEHEIRQAACCRGFF